MKKNPLILAGLVILGFFSWNAQANNLETNPYLLEMNNLPDGYTTIDLQGDLIFNIGPNAIDAGASDDAVYIQFNQTFGNVNISIYNSIGGLVYSTVVNTDVQQVVIIPFSSAAIGTYTVELNNANGYAEGDFEHN